MKTSNTQFYRRSRPADLVDTDGCGITSGKIYRCLDKFVVKKTTLDTSERTATGILIWLCMDTRFRRQVRGRIAATGILG